MDYHQDRFKDHSLLLYKKEKLVALLPANQRENALYSHQGLSYGGLLITKDLKLGDVVECFKLILSYLEENKIHKLHIKQLPPIYSPFPTNELQYLLFILEAKLTGRNTLSSIHMPHRPKMTSERIRGNKRGIKHGLVVKEVDTFDEYWNQILIPNLKKKFGVAPVHTIAEIEQLKAHFPNNIRQFNVYKDDVIVAGTTIFETAFVAHAQYISGNEQNSTLGSMDFLFVHLLDEVFPDKMYFDFGISNENQGKNINEGLHYWKEGFGARTITQDFYEIDVHNRHKLDTIFI